MTQTLTELNQAQPITIDRFVGQRRVVEQVRVALEASWTRQDPLPHMLMTGAAGCGKTALARLVAKEMGSTAIESMGQLLRTPAEVTGLLMRARHDKDLIFIDEIHELPASCQTQLYQAMTDRQTILNTGPFRKSPLMVRLPALTLLAATTDEHRLLKPLRSRFEMTLKFERYQPEELECLLEYRAKAMQWNVESGAFGYLAERSLGIPRTALMLLKSAWRIFVARNGEAMEVAEITLQDARQAVEMIGLDHRGLNEEQQLYLHQLMDHAPLRLSDLASMLDSPMRRVQEVVEPDLKYLGLVCNTRQGRCLTRPGINHVRQLEMREIAHENCK